MVERKFLSKNGKTFDAKRLLDIPTFTFEGDTVQELVKQQKEFEDKWGLTPLEHKTFLDQSLLFSTGLDPDFKPFEPAPQRSRTMSLDDFLKESYPLSRSKTRGKDIPKSRPNIHCEDGYVLSVQASEYVSARGEGRGADTHWQEVEVLTEAVPEWDKYLQLETENGPNVYGFVPVDEVQSLIDKHGGIDRSVSLDTPQFEYERLDREQKLELIEIRKEHESFDNHAEVDAVFNKMAEAKSDIDMYNALVAYDGLRDQMVISPLTRSLVFETVVANKETLSGLDLMGDDHYRESFPDAANGLFGDMKLAMREKYNLYSEYHSKNFDYYQKRRELGMDFTASEKEAMLDCARDSMDQHFKYSEASLYYKTGSGPKPVGYEKPESVDEVLRLQKQRDTALFERIDALKEMGMDENAPAYEKLMKRRLTALGYDDYRNQKLGIEEPKKRRVFDVPDFDEPEADDLDRSFWD